MAETLFLVFFHLACRPLKVEGIGLGLSLAREIARSHRGDLTLDSTPSGQTAFTLTLPIGLHSSAIAPLQFSQHDL
jgi:signal transduction histidine kinase